MGISFLLQGHKLLSSYNCYLEYFFLACFLAFFCYFTILGLGVWGSPLRGSTWIVKQSWGKEEVFGTCVNMPKVLQWGRHNCHSFAVSSLMESQWHSLLAVDASWWCRRPKGGSHFKSLLEIQHQSVSEVWCQYWASLIHARTGFNENNILISPCYINLRSCISFLSTHLLCGWKGMSMFCINAQIKPVLLTIS